MTFARIAGAALAAAFTALSLAPQNAAAAAPSIDEAIAAIAAYAPRALAEQGAPGMAVAITDRTHTIKILTFGYANVESKAPVSETTRFPIGSISKSMTALALLRAHDRGKLDLNANVTTYLPWWSIRSDGKPILVHELLSHTAGIPDDYTFAQYGYAIAALRDAHTLYAPGTSWSYSNDGYATAGAVLARLEGATWQQAIESEVLSPIGMTHTSAEFTPEIMADSATGYLIRDVDRPQAVHPALVPAQTLDLVDPAGSVISSPEDMAAYMRLYLNAGKTATGEELLQPTTFHAMTTADSLRNGKPAGAPSVQLAEWPEFYRQYGYGLAIFDDGGDHLVGHTGGISGYTACMQANLTRGFGVIAMSNLEESPLHPCAIVRYAMAVLRAQSMGTALPQPPAPPPDPATIAEAPQYAGTYVSTGGASLSISASGTTATLHDGTGAYPLMKAATDLLWSDAPHFARYYLHFNRNQNKAVTDVTYGPDFFSNARYVGAKSWPHPTAYDAYTGRYEASVFGAPIAIRVVIVKGHLTFDGLQPLAPQKDGSFFLGDSRVRFDTPAGAKTQRMWLDGADLYRIELP